MFRILCGAYIRGLTVVYLINDVATHEAGDYPTIICMASTVAHIILHY